MAAGNLANWTTKLKIQKEVYFKKKKISRQQSCKNLGFPNILAYLCLKVIWNLPEDFLQLKEISCASPHPLPIYSRKQILVNSIYFYQVVEASLQFELLKHVIHFLMKAKIQMPNHSPSSGQRKQTPPERGSCHHPSLPTSEGLQGA